MEEYQFNIEDFDINKIKDFEKEIIIESDNFCTITEACKDTLKYSRMISIIGEPGFGKTKALEHFADTNRNVIFITVKKHYSSKIFYSKILEKAGWNNAFKESTLTTVIESIGYYLNQSEGKYLIIIDEAGKLSHRNLLYLHDLRDSVMKNTGIVLAGPKYFEANILSLQKKNIEGIQELMRRINIWIELLSPTYAEKRELCKQYGVTNSKLLNFIAKDSKHLGDVYNYINNFGLMYLRNIVSIDLQT